MKTKTCNLILENIDDYNKLVISQLETINNELYHTEIYTIIENDGIGSYEYWGSKGYDKGNDSLIINDYEIFKIIVKLKNDTFTCANIETIMNLLKDLDNSSRTIKQGVNEFKEGVTIEAVAIFKLELVEEHKIIINVEWNEET